ncbi:MAG: hypothetical protein IJ010_07220 [Ruminococcus sp.]|nr:hypothetical protein [Ruminococcus sp.]
MKKTYILITLITALLCYIYCRCSFPKYSKNDKTSKTKVTEMTELTERQKKVLESEGLPTDIDKLSYQQKSGIIHIEKAFEYLDDKYPGVEFEYLSHRPEGILGSQLTKFVPAGYDKEDDRNIVTVERDKFENKYTDDYMCVVTRKPIENVIDKYAESYFDVDNVKTFAFVGGTDLKYGDIVSEETVKGTTYTSIAFFMPENICSEEDLQKFADVITKWNDENQMRCTFRATIVSENDFKEMDDSIFDNYFGKYKLINDISF